MGDVTPLRPVNLGNNRSADHHEHHHSEIGPNEQLVNLINGIARDLTAYNQKVAKITHQEHKLK